MQVRYKIKTAPVFFAVSIMQLKRSLRIEHLDQDELLQELLDAAVDASQNATGRQYARATYTAYLDGFPSNSGINIEKGPVDAIISVKYLAPKATVLTTVLAGKYQLDITDLTARLLFLEPFAPDSEKMNTVEIEFTTGWVDAVSIPKDLASAVILRASGMYLNPENSALNWGFGRIYTAAENKETNYKVQRY